MIAPTSTANAPATSPAALLVVAAVMILAPATGVPSDEIYQGTYKTILMLLGLAVALGAFFWQSRRSGRLHVPAAAWLCLLLSAYALTSALWSHLYFAGSEAVRWLAVALLVTLGANIFSHERFHRLAWGVHAGAVCAALWAMVQFWVEFRFIQQGPNPGSTFLNRNFYAEFAAAALPFGAILLARARSNRAIAALSVSNALAILSIMMTGARASLMALCLMVLVLMPLAGWTWRRHWAFGSWSGGQWLLAIGLLVATVAGLGSVRSGNILILEEERGATALARAANRIASIGPNDYSLSVRLEMWRAGARMISDHPIAGVGAGSWQVALPLYQAGNLEFEADSNAHNEFVQLLAEYGVAGWLFLAALLAYLARAAWLTWRDHAAGSGDEAAIRVTALSSLLAAAITMLTGFGLHISPSIALVGLNLGLLAASDARLGRALPPRGAWLPWNRAASFAGVAAAIAAFAAVAWQSARVVTGERSTVSALKLAMSVNATADPLAPALKPARDEAMRRAAVGLEMDPHERFFTGMVAEEFTKWKEYGPAARIFETMVEVRPNVPGLLTHLGILYSKMNQPDRAAVMLERARLVAPEAPSVRALDVLLHAQRGDERKALELARSALDRPAMNRDLLEAAFTLARQAGDHALAARALELRLRRWPGRNAADDYIQLGNLYEQQLGQPDRAFEAYRQAMARAPAPARPALAARMPPAHAARLGYGRLPDR